MNTIKSEVLKCFDTRSSKVVLFFIVMLTFLMTCFSLHLIKDGQSWVQVLNIISNPAITLLGVLFLNLVTQEWSHGTGLLTFSVSNNRVKVILSKLVVVLLCTTLTYLILSVCSLTTAFVFNTFFEKSLSFAFDSSLFFDTMRVFYTNTLLAYAFALLFKNTTLSVVLYFIVPPLTVILRQVPRIGEFFGFISLGHASSLFIAGNTSQTSLEIAVSTTLWILVPAFVGLCALHFLDYKQS